MIRVFSFPIAPFESETSLNGSFESFDQKDFGNKQSKDGDNNEENDIVDKYLAC